MKGFRKIIVDEKLWWWKFIKSKVVAYSDETKEKRVIDLSTLTGQSWNDIERGEWKHYFSVTPKEVEKWLKEEVK